MHCTVAFLDEYPLPDSFELKAFMQIKSFECLGVVMILPVGIAKTD